MQPFLKQSHYVRSPAPELLCNINTNSICGPQKKMFIDPGIGYPQTKLKLIFGPW